MTWPHGVPWACRNSAGLGQGLGFGSRQLGFASWCWTLITALHTVVTSSNGPLMNLASEQLNPQPCTSEVNIQHPLTKALSQGLMLQSRGAPAFMSLLERSNLTRNLNQSQLPLYTTYAGVSATAATCQAGTHHAKPPHHRVHRASISKALLHKQSCHDRNVTERTPGTGLQYTQSVRNPSYSLHAGRLAHISTHCLAKQVLQLLISGDGFTLHAVQRVQPRRASFAGKHTSPQRMCSQSSPQSLSVISKSSSTSESPACPFFLLAALPALAVLVVPSAAAAAAAARGCLLGFTSCHLPCPSGPMTHSSSMS